MLENDPNANLNREVPVTPTKPKPATHCQKFIARVLPELQIAAKINCRTAVYRIVAKNAPCRAR